MEAYEREARGDLLDVVCLTNHLIYLYPSCAQPIIIIGRIGVLVFAESCPALCQHEIRLANPFATSIRSNLERMDTSPADEMVVLFS